MDVAVDFTNTAIEYLHMCRGCIGLSFSACVPDLKYALPASNYLDAGALRDLVGDQVSSCRVFQRRYFASIPQP